MYMKLILILFIYITVLLKINRFEINFSQSNQLGTFGFIYIPKSFSLVNEGFPIAANNGGVAIVSRFPFFNFKADSTLIIPLT